MKVNFYLDKPYNPEIVPEKVKRELSKVGGKKEKPSREILEPIAHCAVPFLFT
jgi:hypothetical protein